MKRMVVSLCLAAATAFAPPLVYGQGGGPYDRLVIRDAMVIPGHGGPAYGPADLIIENDTIVQIISMNGVTGRPAGTTPPAGDHVIDARGMFVMPGLIDLHTHIRTEPLPLQYVYNMKLAHGVHDDGERRGARISRSSLGGAALGRERHHRASDVPHPRLGT